MGGLAVYLSRLSSVGGVAAASRLAGKTGYFGFFQDGEKNALIALSFVLAWTISPIAWQRIQAAGSVEKARRGLWAAAGGFVVLYGLVVFCGVFSLASFSGRTLGHPLIFELITSRAGGLGGALLFVIVVAAVLSTLDTALNTGAQTLTQDFYFEVFPRAKADSRSGVRAGRLATLLVALAAFGIAVRLPSILRTLGLASEILAEGLFVPGIAMFVLKKRTPLAGALSLFLGGGFALASFLSTLRAIPLDLPAWPYSVPYGVGLSLIGYFAGRLFDRNPA
jgi:SSS family solute:Na+ symporter